MNYDVIIITVSLCATTVYIFSDFIEKLFGGFVSEEQTEIDTWIEALNTIYGGDWYFCEEGRVFKDYMTDRTEDLLED